MTSTNKFIITNTHSNNRKKNDFNKNKINFTDVKTVGKSGRRTVYISYDSYNKLHIQTPYMRVPYDITSYDNDNNINDYKLTLSFNDLNNDEQKDFHKLILDIDNHLKDYILQNEDVSQKWFGTKHKHKEVIETLYNPMLKINKDENGEPTGKYPDSIKIKLPYYSDKFAFSLFNKNTKEEIENNDILKNLVKGCEVKLLMECTGVYFISKNMYGLSWKVIQASVDVPETIQGYCMIDDEREEDLDLQKSCIINSDSEDENNTNDVTNEE